MVNETLKARIQALEAKILHLERSLKATDDETVRLRSRIYCLEHPGQRPAMW